MYLGKKKLYMSWKWSTWKKIKFTMNQWLLPMPLFYSYFKKECATSVGLVDLN